MVTKWTILAVTLPVLTLLGGVVRGELHLAHGKEWEFEVTGYDPRDLLHGRYINYRIVFNEVENEEGCVVGSSECCYCLNGPAGSVPEVSRLECKHAKSEPSCDGVLGTLYLGRLRRYYVPEDQAKAAESKLRRAARDGTARAVLSIDANGRPMLKELRVDGASLLE